MFSRNNPYCIMTKLKLASHNSFTYLKPRKWYMRPFGFIAKCQSKSIKEQYGLNARLFDVRIAYDSKHRSFLKHGLISYNQLEDMMNDLYWLDSRSSKKDPVYIRLILERNKPIFNTSKTATKRVIEETFFIGTCLYLKKLLPNIKFIGGVRKYDWVCLHSFGNKTPDMEADFSSVKGSKLNDLWPWLYAKLHNKKAKKSCKKKWLMLDFIEIG